MTYTSVRTLLKPKQKNSYMGRPRILDAKIMSKLAKKIGKADIVAINKRVSSRAAKHGISAEAALVLLAKEQGIGTSGYQRKLDATKQAEIRDLLPNLFTPVSRGTGTAIRKTTGRKAGSVVSTRTSLRSAIEYLIQDQELLSRCTDILMAPRNFDRPINQATLILEERIRQKVRPSTGQNLVGENLVNYAFKEDSTKTILQVASRDENDQRGFTQILRGIVPTFRNKTHHHVINSFSREEAMRVCGFIDVLLRVVDNSVKIR